MQVPVVKDKYTRKEKENSALFRTHASSINNKPGAMRGSLRERKKYSSMS